MTHQARDLTDVQSREDPDLVRPYSLLQLHFLARLEQLDRLREEYEQSSRPDPFLLQLVKKAIYSTLRDCESYGLHEEAKAVISGVRAGKL